jgi:hypothetical protein
MVKKYEVFVTNSHFSVQPNAIKPLDFGPKFNFLNRKKLYTKLLCITNVEYGLHDQQIWSFDSFLTRHQSPLVPSLGLRFGLASRLHSA